MDCKRYYAHTIDGKSEGEWQTIKSHAENVAALTKKFSAQWCTEEYAGDLGLLHGVGNIRTIFSAVCMGKCIG